MEVTVPADDPWFDTKMSVSAGDVIEITVPDGQTWTDWYIPSGPQGRTTFIQALALPWLRVRTDDNGKRGEFFTLIAAIVTAVEPHQLKQRFAVGQGPLRFTARFEGKLICFANDVLRLYGNNKGSMTIHVQKL
jgi:hypothetical protein